MLVSHSQNISVWVDLRQFLRLFLSQRLKTNKKKQVLLKCRLPIPLFPFSCSSSGLPQLFIYWFIVAVHLVVYRSCSSSGLPQLFIQWFTVAVHLVVYRSCSSSGLPQLFIQWFTVAVHLVVYRSCFLKIDDDISSEENLIN